MKSYYLVNEGDVTAIDVCVDNLDEVLENDHRCTEDNANDWAIAYAKDESDALRIVDLGLQPDNVWCTYCNRAHAAIRESE